MNFLAHLYLSGQNDKIRLGNFIADSIKGKKYLNYDKEVQKGIILHRNIDYYTDNHPIVKECKSKISSKYRKHSGIIIDLFFDHLLAVNWKKYSNHDLHKYANNSYRLLINNFFTLPLKVKIIMPFMIINNWLETYKTINGLTAVIRRMSYNTSLPGETEFAIKTFKNNYNYFDEKFNIFFDDIIKFVEKNNNVKIKE